jgi:hypothetical protein
VFSLWYGSISLIIVRLAGLKGLSDLLDVLRQTVNVQLNPVKLKCVMHFHEYARQNSEREIEGYCSELSQKQSNIFPYRPEVASWLGSRKYLMTWKKLDVYMR